MSVPALRVCISSRRRSRPPSLRASQMWRKGSGLGLYGVNSLDSAGVSGGSGLHGGGGVQGSHGGRRRESFQRQTGAGGWARGGKKDEGPTARAGGLALRPARAPVEAVEVLDGAADVAGDEAAADAAGGEELAELLGAGHELHAVEGAALDLRRAVCGGGGTAQVRARGADAGEAEWVHRRGAEGSRGVASEHASSSILWDSACLAGSLRGVEQESTVLSRMSHTCFGGSQSVAAA